jgi:hypothetical protein
MTSPYGQGGASADLALGREMGSIFVGERVSATGADDGYCVNGFLVLRLDCCEDVGKGE